MAINTDDLKKRNTPSKTGSIGSVTDPSLGGALATSLQGQSERFGDLIVAANISIDAAAEQIVSHMEKIVSGEALASAVLQKLSERKGSQYQVSGFKPPILNLPPVVDVSASTAQFRRAFNLQDSFNLGPATVERDSDGSL